MTKRPDRRPLRRDSEQPLYQQIADRLATEISDGRLAPGAQVPSEAALIDAFGVSRITVRQAVALLARNGQVVARRGKGTFVSRPALHHDLDTLQGFQEGLRRQGIEPRTELLEWSASAGRADRSVPEGLDLPVRLRRLYSVDDAPFAIVEAFLPREAGTLGIVRARRLMVYEILEQFLGLRIARADIVIRCASPGAERGRALGVPSKTPMLVMERTSYATHGAACEFMRIHIVPERYAFRLSLPGPIEIAPALQRFAPGVRTTASSAARGSSR